MSELDILAESIAVRYSNGAKPGDTDGVRLPKVSPLFDEWASSGTNPPGGIGVDRTCGWFGAGVFGTDLIAVVRSDGGTGRGLYRYTLNVANDPLTITYQSMVTAGSLGMTWWQNEGAHYFDYSTGDFVVMSFANASRTDVAGRWNVSSWPPTLSNHIWVGVDTKYPPPVQAGLVSWWPLPFFDPDNDRILVASGSSGKIGTYRYSDGAFLGEWEFDNAFSNAKQPQILGIYPGSTDVIMAYYEASSLLLNSAFRYDASNPAAWIKSDPNPILDSAISTAATLGSARPFKRLPNGPSGTYTRLHGLSRSELNLLGANSNEIGWSCFFPTLSGITYGARFFIIYNPLTDSYREFEVTQPCSYARSGQKVSSVNLCSFVRIDSNAWMIYATGGTIDHFAEKDEFRFAGGLAAMQIGPGTVEYDHQKTFPITPKKITCELAGTVDSENSCHPGKHRVSLSVDGGVYTAPRSGDESLKLQQTVNGKPPWPTIPANVPFTLRHDLHSGVIENWAQIQGNPGDVTTPNLPISEIGPPYDVKLKLDFDLPGVGGGLL